MNIRLKSILFAVLSLPAIQSHAQIITTIGGNGTGGFSGDGAAATSAEIYDPESLALDHSGNLYIADLSNNRIRKISTSGIITTVAGNGSSTYSGDGAAATAAGLPGPFGVAVDNAGNIYIAASNRIRKVNTSGVITTIAGTGITGYTGDNGPATLAMMNAPRAVAVDNADNVYIADEGNERIRKVNTLGIITTFAGTGVVGFSGDGGPATAARLYEPNSFAIDDTGNIYFVDWNNSRVRKIDTAGIINTVAGNGVFGTYSGDGGPATAAGLYEPQGVAVDAYGNIYIGDEANNRVRKVNTAGIISTYAGNGTAGFAGDGGPATACELHSPAAVVVDNSLNLYIADLTNNRIRKVTPSATTTVNSIQNACGSITFYPNPAQNVLTVSSSAPVTIVTVINMLGQTMISTNFSGQTKTQNIDVSGMPPGVYFLKINNSEVRRFVKS